VTFVLDYVIDSSEIKILNDVIIEEDNRGNKRSANCFGMECGFVELFEPRSTGTHEETPFIYLLRRYTVVETSRIVETKRGHIVMRAWGVAEIPKFRVFF